MSEVTTESLHCPSCRYPNGDESLVCDLCGFLLRRNTVDPSEAMATAALPLRVTHGCRRASERAAARHHATSPEDVPTGLDRDTKVALGIGALLAPVFLLTPLLEYMGWFFASLCHEMGHCAAAWYAGCPAYPAISLQGHAAALHGEPVLVLSLVIFLALAVQTWRSRRQARARLLFGALALTYPIVAWTPAREVIFLLAGQGGELAFAGVFLHRALTGGFTESRAERTLYAACSFYLLGRNLWLDGGLIFSAAVRRWYLGSGSFGLTNDYLRVSGHHLQVGLSAVAGFMLLLTLATPALAWWLARRHPA